MGSLKRRERERGDFPPFLSIHKYISTREKPATEENQYLPPTEKKESNERRTDSDRDHMARYQSKCRHHDGNKQPNQRVTPPTTVRDIFSLPTATAIPLAHNFL